MRTCASPHATTRVTISSTSNTVCAGTQNRARATPPLRDWMMPGRLGHAGSTTRNSYSPPPSVTHAASVVMAISTSENVELTPLLAHTHSGNHSHEHHHPRRQRHVTLDTHGPDEGHARSVRRLSGSLSRQHPRWMAMLHAKTRGKVFRTPPLRPLVPSVAPGSRRWALTFDRPYSAWYRAPTSVPSAKE